MLFGGRQTGPFSWQNSKPASCLLLVEDLGGSNSFAPLWRHNFWRLPLNKSSVRPLVVVAAAVVLN